MFSWFTKSSENGDVTQKVRQLGATENILMHTSRKCQGYMKFGEVLHLNGPVISLEALAKAINCLQRRHPILRSRLQMNSQKPNSYLLEEDETVQLKIQEIPRKRADHKTFWQEEWRKREKQSTEIGEGVAEFVILQDPDDANDENSPREIIIICEHSVSDGLSLSTVAHELLIALTDKDSSLFADSLPWPITMEEAIRNTVGFANRIISLSRVMFSAMYNRATNKSKTGRIPISTVDFPLADMENHCHSAMSYAILNKDETHKLIENCRQVGVTVTSAVCSAILYALSISIPKEDGQTTALSFSIGADTRRRCIPSIPNHDLTYHVSGMLPFVLPVNDVPTTNEGMWQLAKNFRQHMEKCIDAGQVLALGAIMAKLYEKSLTSQDVSQLPSAGVSSWGLLPFQEQYGQWKLEGMSPIVNTIRSIFPFTTIQTVNGVLTIMFIGNDPLIPITILDKLRDDTLQKLHEMIQN